MDFAAFFLVVFVSFFWGMLHLGYACLISGLCWAIGGYVGTILGSCWAMLVYFVVCVGLCWAILAYLGPFQCRWIFVHATRSQKNSINTKKPIILGCVADGFCCDFLVVCVSFFWGMLHLGYACLISSSWGGMGHVQTQFLMTESAGTGQGVDVALPLCGGEGMERMQIQFRQH